MMFLQASFSQKKRKQSPYLESFSSKKRKWLEVEECKGEDFTIKEPKLWKKDQENIELHFDAPLPLEWQRCLDIKSGQIHFYNSRTHERTSKDPRSSREPPPSLRPSLDLELELKLTCNNYPTKQVDDGDQEHNLHELSGHNDGNSINSSLDCIDQQEMVAAVCTRCHMLVMMCKASPSCPNCKFVHPQEGQSSFSSLLPKIGFRLMLQRLVDIN